MSDLFNTEAEAGAYLAALIDGEGCLFRSQYSRRVEIVNTDESIITAATEACDVLGITYTISNRKPRVENWKPYTILRIQNRSNLERIRESATPRSTVKMARLNDLLESYRPKAVAV